MTMTVLRARVSRTSTCGVCPSPVCFRHPTNTKHTRREKSCFHHRYIASLYLLPYRTKSHRVFLFEPFDFSRNMQVRLIKKETKQNLVASGELQKIKPEKWMPAAFCRLTRALDQIGQAQAMTIYHRTIPYMNTYPTHRFHFVFLLLPVDLYQNLDWS